MGIRSNSHPVVRTAFASFVISLLAAFAAAQQRPRVLAPHDAVAPQAKTHTQLPSIPGSVAGGPWIVDAHDQSILYLKNIVETSSITITPVLHLSDGTKYRLSSVQLDPSGIAKVDIGASLESMGIAPNATLSGWVELQYNWPWEPLCASIRVVDLTRSVIFSFGFAAPGPISSQAEKATASQVREGMWWKQEKNVTGFVTLANTTPRPITATVQVKDNGAAVLGSHTITVPPQGMETLNLLELQATAGTEGGIRVTWAGAPDGLLVNGGLEDVGVGYSANLLFTEPERPLPPMAHAITPQSIAELGLMTGAADPYMNFPAGTVFTPYSVIRNISTAPISVTPTLWWMQGSAPASFQLPSIHLLPSQTYSLNMPALLASAGLKSFSGSLNLVFDTQGASGLLMAAGSVDQTNTYVFEVSPRGTTMSAGKNLSYWSTGNGDDTMVTIWNPADEAQTFTFRLIFAGGHYDDVMTLGPRATAMFDISDIIRSAGADAEGNIIPAGTQEGSAKLIGIEAENQHILLAMDAGVYNVRKATCVAPCDTCDGSISYSVSADPFSVFVGDDVQEHLTAHWNTGQQYDYTNDSNTSWSSSDTSVATVQTGLVTGIIGGSTNVLGADYHEPVYTQVCGLYHPACPIAGGGGGSAPGDVVNLSCTTVTRGGTTTCTATAPTGSTYSLWKFTDSSGNTVTSSTTSNTWSGIAVQSGTVSVKISMSDGGASALSRALTVIPRNNFAFTAVNPSQISGNSITCYLKPTVTLPSPPYAGSQEGYSCADLAYSFNSATISDGGPNNGYQYVTSASDADGSNPTKYEYIVVSDLLGATTFYNSQCGTYSTSDISGFIAGSQLKQNTFNHESGAVLSHWTEYRDTQNSNNIGIALEAAIGPPGSSGTAFATTPANAAENAIGQATQGEPCGADVRKNSSQSCGFCGAINFSPYTSCGSSQPAAYCQP